jgi:large subunit ribosomal protein L2
MTVLKKLSEGSRKGGGRNNTGRITVFHRGGGHKRRYRYVDLERNLVGVPAVVKEVMVDPNRTGYIALVAYSNGLLSYILAAEGVSVGDVIISGDLNRWEEKGVQRLGSVLPLKEGSAGELLCNVELIAGKGGQLARSAGSYVEFVKLEEEVGEVTVKLTSGEMKTLKEGCRAMVGSISNSPHGDEVIGKAGVSRWLGRRPVVRGVAMNPVDHPHGGGEGKKSGRNKTPWGRITKGRKTRRKG